MWWIVFAIVLIFLYYHHNNAEGLTSKPSDREKVMYVNEILEHKDYFTDDGLNKSRKKWDWMDPVLYEEIRRLNYQGGGINEKNVYNLL